MNPTDLMNSIEMRSAIEHGAAIPPYLFDWVQGVYNNPTGSPFNEEEVIAWTLYAMNHAAPKEQTLNLRLEAVDHTVPILRQLRSGDYRKAVEDYAHKAQFEPPPTIHPIFHKNRLVGFSAEVDTSSLMGYFSALNEVGRTLQAINENSPNFWKDLDSES